MNIIQIRNGWLCKFIADNITSDLMKMEDNILSGKNPIKEKSEEQIYRSHLKLAMSNKGIVYMHNETNEMYEYRQDNSIGNLSIPLEKVEDNFVRWASSFDV